MAPEDSPARLAALRALMREHKLDAYMVPSEDAHASEYLAPCDARRAFITGFTGSAGVAVVTHDTAKCWTDGRYWLQAEKQLGQGWELMKAGDKDVPTVANWIKDTLAETARVGIDPTVLPFSQLKTLRGEPALVGKPPPTPKPTYVPITTNLIDAIWTDRPARPKTAITDLPEDQHGYEASQKAQDLQDKLKAMGSPGTVISQLDEVAWLFNCRAQDIPYNPVFFSYALITQTSKFLFLQEQPDKLDPPVLNALTGQGVDVRRYEDFLPTMQSWGKKVGEDRERARLEAEQAKKAGLGGEPPEKRQKTGTELDPADTKGNGASLGDDEAAKKKKELNKLPKTDKVIVGDKVSWAVVEALGEDNCEVRRSLVEDKKAEKTPKEIEGFRNCHIRDGAALVRYFAWLEKELGQPGVLLTEYDAAQKLEEFRSENEKFKGLSFDTISSTGANAAVIHYSPPAEGSAVIDPKQIYLCDSGAQYLDGTTDVTRTLHFGEPSEEEKFAFTRVGHIDLDTIIFPTGTTGYILDILARRALWSAGLDYRHGTGHGVGCFLNVHEGPQGVGIRPAYNEVPLAVGHVISNEPGYYADGKFGIRIEGVQVVKKVETRWNFGDKGFLGFEHFTMCPIQTKLVQKELLAPDQLKWLNDYHEEVLAKVLPVLEKFQDQTAIEWLRKECKAI